MNDTLTDKQLDEEAALFRSLILPAAKTAEAAPGLTLRILGAVARERRRERRARVFRAAAAGVAALLALAFIPRLFTDGAASDAAAPTVAHSRTMAGDAADWLVAQQCADGTWSPAQTGGNEAFRPALTALALMALQRHAPVRHAAAIARAEKALEGLQTADGAFSDSPSSKLYNHAFATFALLSLRNERGEAPTPAIRRALAFSLRSQNASGAWDYTAREPGNTALTVWQLGILLEARKAGWEDDAGQLRRGLAWLRKRGHDGIFDYREAFDRQYTPRAGSLTLTAMATATLLEAAETFPELRPTAENAVASLRLAHGRSEERATRDHYRDYFLCRAFRDGADAGIAESIADSIAAQHSQTTSRAVAPWKAEDVWSSTGGDLYATVMALLSVRRG